MRCLTLAQTLKSDGVDVHFICRAHKGNLIDLIVERGFTVSVLPASDKNVPCLESEPLQYSDWLGCDWENDSVQCRNKIIGVVDWLIVDHYSLDFRWESSLRDKCRFLMVIDDLADRKHNCDLLLDQNLGRTSKDYTDLVYTSTKLLMGTRFCLLRPEFLEWRSVSISQRMEPKLENIMIAMGGVDSENVTKKVLATLENKTNLKLKSITVVLGPHAPWLQDIKSFSKSMRVPTKVLHSVENIAELMSSSDVSVGAGGSTTWERCVLGLPSILICIADNQKGLLEAVDKYRAGLTIRSLFKLEDSLEEMLNILHISKNLKDISRNCSKIVDGNGAFRTSNIMRCYLE